ncbi:MAG: GGDEF domain-containing protein [Gammaproteobacteria bacterium]|nr:GGDEF domain-containing protein [Gammaproteobacteria bacterium]
MSQDLVNRYKKSIRLSFQNAEIESQYRKKEDSRGRSSSVFAFSVLFFINIAFCYLEFRAFGVETSLPMYGYLASALLALSNALLSQFGNKPYMQKIRLFSNVALSMGVVMAAVYLQKYSAYHTAEMSLLVIWLASLNAMRLVLSSVASVVGITAYLILLYVAEVSVFWLILVAVFLIVAAMLGGYLSYLLERQRRMLFLRAMIIRDMNSRQESWAFSLIDLDMALGGITDFKELIGLLKKYLEPVIKFESYVLTSLEGQGPKPIADKVEGRLFEDEDKTIWSQDLLSKLTQTRQATISSEHETVKGFLGIPQEKFTSYRLDVPVFSDSKLMGVISLRRADEAFDDLDMIAGVSISTQAMLIYKRSTKNAAMVLDSSVPDPVIRKPKLTTPVGRDPAKDLHKTLADKMLATQSTNLEFTDNSDPVEESLEEIDQQVAPAELIKKIRQEEEQSKKTITLLSRENADKISIDRYRSAAIEGEPLSILIIEVDGLSKLREQDGDQVAYKVFAAIVKYIFSQVDKEKDVLGRYGQNGLSVLMPRVDMNAAERFAESIRQFVARAVYKTTFGDKSATLSIGVAALTDETGDYGAMVKRADMALFVAKKNGRNCVKVRL